MNMIDIYVETDQGLLLVNLRIPVASEFDSIEEAVREWWTKDGNVALMVEDPVQGTHFWLPAGLRLFIRGWDE